MENTINEAYITMPKGFKANGVNCGMKTNPANFNPDLPKNKYLDMGLILSDVPANVAGAYTSNLVKGHSLVRSIKLINTGNKVRGIVINSKNANAAVGPIGIEDAEEVAASIASLVGCSSSEILTASTGVIGSRLPKDKLIAKVPELVSGLASDAESAHKAEFAMMTTDTVPKEVSASITLKNGKEVTLSGMAKGSGMIHPNLATMISVFTTDADISADLLDKMVKKAVKHTFNRVSVDGDTSVCDMIVIFSNGVSGETIEESTEDAEIFQEAFTKLAEDISRMLAADGEGATKFVEIECFNAKTEYDAYLVVSAIAKSPLVKTAIFGMDANCGRIVTAAGYSGAKFNPDKLDVKVNGYLFYKDGCALPFDEDEAKKLLEAHDINIQVFLNDGEFYDRMFTCDFSYDYVKINGDYRT